METCIGMALSKPIKVVLVDDEPNIQQEVSILFRNFQGFVLTGTAMSVRKAQTLVAQTSPDLLLLDIDLPDGTAFNLLDRLKAPFLKVIFLTSHHEFAIRAIKVGALDYLLKPIDSQELYASMQKVLQNALMSSDQLTITQHTLATKNVERLVLRFQDFLEVVYIEDIVYCSAEGSYTAFILSNGNKLLSSRNLKEYEDILPANRFLRPHQSYLVNDQFIHRYHREGHLSLKTGQQIPVAVRRREEVIDYLNNIQ